MPRRPGGIHGYTRNHVEQLRVVWDDGTADVVNGVESGSRRLLELVRRDEALLQNNSDAIAASQPKTAFNRCGYPLHEVATPNGPDLFRLLVGSEGTLAFTTEAAQNDSARRRPRGRRVWVSVVRRGPSRGLTGAFGLIPRRVKCLIVD